MKDSATSNMRKEFAKPHSQWCYALYGFKEASGCGIE